MPQKKRRKFLAESKRIDTRKGRWPTEADNARMEAQAIAARIRELILRAEEAIDRNRPDEARRLLSLAYDKAGAIEDMMKLVKDGKWRDS